MEELEEGELPSDEYEKNIVAKTQGYELGKELGRGSYGRVYLGKVIKSGLPVVIKQVVKNDKTRDILLDEIKALRELENEGKYFVHMINSFQTPDYYYIVYDYLKDYVTLKYFIDGLKKLTPILKLPREQAVNRLNRLVKIICNMIAGLRRMHNKDVIHLDIKPENIMVDMNNDDIKFIDFGLSCWGKYCDRYLGYRGDRKYVAPEVYDLNPLIRYNSSIYRLSDYFSLGATIFELLTLQPFFVSDRMKNIFPTDLYDFILGIYPELLELVSKMVNDDLRYRLSDLDRIALCNP